MSDYESHFGKVKLAIPKDNENFEQQCKRLWSENGLPKEDYGEARDLFNELSDKYLKVNFEIWEIIEQTEESDADMYCHLNDNGDGTFTFRTRFYNGGTCMSEMVTEALENRNDES